MAAWFALKANTVSTCAIVYDVARFIFSVHRLSTYYVVVASGDSALTSSICVDVVTGLALYSIMYRPPFASYVKVCLRTMQVDRNGCRLIWVVCQCRFRQLLQSVSCSGVGRSLSSWMIICCARIRLTRLGVKFVAEDTGLFKSAVLSTLPTSIIAFVIPDVVPALIGLADATFKLRAVCNPATSMVYTNIYIYIYVYL